MKVPCCCKEGFLKVIAAGPGHRVDREYGAFPTSAALRDGWSLRSVLCIRHHERH